MGSSKSHRAGPSWQGSNTPGAKEVPVTKGGIVNPMGSQMSGYDLDSRKRSLKGARNKSSSRTSSMKNGPFGC